MKKAAGLVGAFLLAATSFAACGGASNSVGPNAWRKDYVGKYEFDRIIIVSGDSYVNDLTDIVTTDGHAGVYEAVGAEHGADAVKTQVETSAAKTWFQFNADGTSQYRSDFMDIGYATLSGEWRMDIADDPGRLDIVGMESDGHSFVFTYGGGRFNFLNKEITLNVALPGEGTSFVPTRTTTRSRFQGQRWVDSRSYWSVCATTCAKGQLDPNHGHISTDFDGIKAPDEWIIDDPEVYYEFYAVYKVK